MLFGLKPSSRMGRLFAVSQPSAAIGKTKQNQTKQKNKKKKTGVMLSYCIKLEPLLQLLLLYSRVV
jgi:hypothetical protein